MLLNTRTSLVATAALTIGLSLSGCAKHAITVAPVGFLSQPTLMTKAGDGSWNYIAPAIDWSQYTSVWVAPVIVAPDAMVGGLWGKEEDLPGLAAEFQRALVDAMAARYTPVQAAGAGVLVVRAQITKAAPNAPARNIAPQTQIGGSGYGYGQVAIEVLDGGAGVVLVELADVQSTTRFSTEKMTVWGSLEKSFGDWAKRIATTCGAQ